MHDKLRKLAMSLGLLALLTGCAPAAPAATPTTKAAAPSPAAGTSTAATPAAPAITPKPSAAEPRYGGTLTGWDAIEPEHLDIQQANSGGTLWPMGEVYDGLIQHSPSPPHKIVPELAQSWEVSTDSKVYTFNLTPGVKWHDGQPFTPEDVVFSLDRMRDPPRGVVSPRKTIYSAIDTVEAAGPDKVKVTLKYPSPSLLEAMAIGWSVIMPKHVILAKGDMKNTAVGTGPFKFKQYVAGTSVSVEKNKDYFVKGQPYLDGITWYIIKDKSVQMAAFRTKRVLVTGYGSRGLQPSEVELIKKEISGVQVFEYPGGGSGQTLTLNATKPPFDSLKARQAVALALDQDEIIKVAIQGGGQVTGPVGPATNEWALPEKELLSLPGIRKPTPNDIAAAKNLLADAGYASGIKTGFPFRAASQAEDIAQVVKAQLAKIGVDITLQRQEAGVFQDTQRNRAWDMIQTSHVAIMNDPDGLLIWFITGSTNNFSGFSDKTVDDLYAKQAQTIDVVERKRIVNEIERRLIDQAPMLRLFEWTQYFAAWPDLKGFTGVGVGSMNNTRWAHVWLAQ